jgi:glycosyltransferase involved in cell wall biosynthesis
MVYHGIDTNAYAPPPLPRPRNKQILCISHVNAGNYLRKCLGAIIESAPLVLREHPEAVFSICGAQEEQTLAKVTTRVRELGIEKSVVFPGRISEAEKLRRYHENALYLQPTLHEGFGLAIAEAMSCGLPVITSPAGSVPEVVGDAGLYCPGNAPAAIAEQVNFMLADESLRERLSRAGRERICNYFPYKKRRAHLAAVVEAVLETASPRPVRELLVKARELAT